MVVARIRESFRDAHSVELKTKYVFDFRSVPGRGAAGHHFKVKNVFCFKLDAKSTPEALETTIRILLMFSIVLAHSRG